MPRLFFHGLPRVDLACVFECVSALSDPSKLDQLFYGLSSKIVVSRGHLVYVSLVLPRVQIWGREGGKKGGKEGGKEGFLLVLM